MPSGVLRKEKKTRPDIMDTAISSAVPFILTPTPSPDSLSSLDTSTTRYPSSSNGDSRDDKFYDGLLILIPVSLVVFIMVVLLGAYKWQQAERRNGGESLCHAWRRRIGRYRSPRRRNNPAAAHGRVTTLGGSTAVLVEELTDIDGDIWDAHLDEEEEKGDKSKLDPTTEQLTHSSSTSSSSNTDSEMYVCTVEVHSDPFLEENSTVPEPSSSTAQRSASLSQSTTDDEDVSTQALELSPSSLTSPSYYSAHSSSAPSLATSHRTLHSSDTLASSSLSSETGEADMAQEIVDVVQSKDFAESAATAVLRCGSSQLSLFTAVNENRGCPANSSQFPVEGSGTNGAVVATRVSQTGPERIVIPLNELQDTRFGASIMWEEDWDRELQTTL